jgi:Spy/CpxP family protein refolding chaperone
MVKRPRTAIGPRARATALLVLTGTLGLFVGMAVDRLFAGPAAAPPAPAEWQPSGEPGRPPPPFGRRGFPSRAAFSAQMADELDLAPDQRAAIEAILAEQEPRIQSLMAEFQPRFRAIAEDTRQRIEGVLTPEQRQELRELRRDQMRRNRFSGDGERPVRRPRGENGEAGSRPRRPPAP